MTNGIPAVSAHQGDAGVFHLPIGRILVTKLSRRFDDLKHPLNVPLGKLSTGSIAGKFAIQIQRPGRGKLPAFAFLAEAVVLQLHEHHVGEAVVNLGGIDVFRPDPRHPIGGLSTLRGGGADHVIFREPASQVVGGGGRQNVNRRLSQLLCPVCAT